MPTDSLTPAELRAEIKRVEKMQPGLRRTMKLDTLRFALKTGAPIVRVPRTKEGVRLREGCEQ